MYDHCTEVDSSSQISIIYNFSFRTTNQAVAVTKGNCAATKDVPSADVRLKQQTAL